MAATIQQVDFRDATRQQAKASILIEGLTGKGKSGLAIAIGKALTSGDESKLFACDTENKSLDLFEGITMHDGVKCGKFKKYDLLPLYGYSPSNYLAIKEAAKQNGGLAFINDSITHLWTREGGVLALVDQAKKTTTNRAKDWSAWGDDTVVAEKNAIFDIVRDSDIHVISTVRMKERHELIVDNGKSELRSLGDQEICMPDLKYEPDLVIRMESAGTTNGKSPKGTIIKSRYAIFAEGQTYDFTAPLIQQLVDYLKDGADPAELLEMQRQELIGVITNILNSDPSKKTMFPLLKEQFGFKDVKLIDMPLKALQTLLGVMIN